MLVQHDMGTVLSLSKSATSFWLEASEITLLIFGIVLVIGLVGEFAKSDTWKRRLRLFELMVIVGVAGELIADGGIFLFSRQLQTISEAEFAGLNKQAADAYKEAESARKEADSFERDIAQANERAAAANERAAKAEQHLGEANERAANAEKQAAKSNEIAERERLARLQLEARLAPRSLSPAQRDDLTNRLKPFSGTGLDIFIYGDTSEMLSIGLTLASVATAAGWSVRTWGVSVEMVVTGVVVGTKSGADKGVHAAANALVLALNRNGINTSPGNVFDLPLPGRLTGPPWDTNKTAPIRMLIGSKP
jgi:hypothetical protein